MHLLPFKRPKCVFVNYVIELNHAQSDIHWKINMLIQLS